MRKLPPACESADWDRYELAQSDTVLVVEDGRIEEIECYEELYFKDRNLVGMSFETLKGLLGSPEEIEEDLSVGEVPARYTELGLTVFVNSDQVIAAAFCSAGDPESEGMRNLDSIQAFRQDIEPPG